MKLYGQQSTNECHKLVNKTTSQPNNMTGWNSCKCSAYKGLAEPGVESQVTSHLTLHWWGLRQMTEGVGHCLLQPLW